MSSSKKRKTTVGPAGRPNSDINVTPLVDVVLVLLIIFMVVTPLLEKDIDVRVPDVEEIQDPAVEPPPDQLVVQLNERGELSINTHPVAGKDYVDELKKILLNKKSDDRLVFFTADDKTNYEALINALDGAKQAGAEILGMMTEPVDQNPAGAAPTPAPGGK